jgi:hypothetical protein
MVSFVNKNMLSRLLWWINGRNDIHPFYLLEKNECFKNPSLLWQKVGQKRGAEQDQMLSHLGSHSLAHSVTRLLSAPFLKQFNFAAAFVAALLLKWSRVYMQAHWDLLKAQ